MGIKFYCPNGHKLNVKAFLAGKKAICPKCGVKVIVPDDLAESGSEKILLDPEELGALATAQASSVGRKKSTGDHASAAGPPVGRPASVPLAAAAVDAAVGAAAPVTSAQAAAAPGANGPAAVDPIDEAPTAVWYVRPPSGGQFGPAGGETMRSWLNEGRVTGDTLVWRAGWPEWRLAAAAFPKQIQGAAPTPAAEVPPAAPAVAPLAPAVHAAPVAAPVRVSGIPVAGGAGLAVAAVSAVPTAAAVLPVGQLPTGQLPVGQLAMGALPEAPLAGLAEENFEGTYRRRRRRQSQDVTKIVTGVLVGLTIVLVVILAFVLKRQADAQKTSTLPPAHRPPTNVWTAIAPRACSLPTISRSTPFSSLEWNEIR
jgi:hypothetical protein